MVDNLKGSSTYFTHPSVVTGLGKCCICEESSIKPFVAPEKAVRNLVSCLQ